MTGSARKRGGEMRDGLALTDGLFVRRRPALRASRQALRWSQRALRPSQQALRSSQQVLRSSQQALRSSQQALRSSARRLFDLRNRLFDLRNRLFDLRNRLVDLRSGLLDLRSSDGGNGNFFPIAERLGRRFGRSRGDFFGGRRSGRDRRNGRSDRRNLLRSHFRNRFLGFVRRNDHRLIDSGSGAAARDRARRQDGRANRWFARDQVQRNFGRTARKMIARNPALIAGGRLIAGEGRLGQRLGWIIKRDVGRGYGEIDAQRARRGAGCLPEAKREQQGCAGSKCDRPSRQKSASTTAAPDRSSALSSPRSFPPRLSPFVAAAGVVLRRHLRPAAALVFAAAIGAVAGVADAAATAAGLLAAERRPRKSPPWLPTSRAPDGFRRPKRIAGVASPAAGAAFGLREGRGRSRLLHRPLFPASSDRRTNRRRPC